MPRILGIDPGTSESGVVVWNSATGWLSDFGVVDNGDLRHDLMHGGPMRDVLVFETMTPYAAGKTTMYTLIWLGRFIEVVAYGGDDHHEVTRQKAVKHITGSARAKKGDKRSNDTRIRDALIARFPATGGGRVPQIGTKSQPGPLYGMARHMWAALAVAITWYELEGEAR